MAGPITTGALAKFLWPGVYARWGMGYNETNHEYKSLVDVLPSLQAYEEVVQVSPFPVAPVMPEGSAVTYVSQTQGTVTRYVNVNYGLGYGVTQNEIEDNLYEGFAQDRAFSLGESCRETIEIQCASMYNNGFSASFPIADGQAWFSTAHPLLLGGTLSNTLAVSADLSEASLEDSSIAVDQFVDDAGIRKSIYLRSLIVAPQNKFNAQRILKSTFQSGTPNNDINALNTMDIFPEGIKVNRYLTSPQAYFMRTTVSGRGQGPTMFERRPVTFTNDNDFSTDNLQYKATFRFSVGVSDPRSCFGVNGP